MAFLDAKNFVLPLVEKKTIMSIIMITVLFAVFRSSGAHIELRKGKKRANASIPAIETTTARSTTRAPELEGDTPLEALVSMKKNRAPSPSRRRTARSIGGADPLADIVKPRKKKPKPQKQERRVGALGDIERDLGLIQ